MLPPTVFYKILLLLLYCILWITVIPNLNLNLFLTKTFLNSLKTWERLLGQVDMSELSCIKISLIVRWLSSRCPMSKFVRSVSGGKIQHSYLTWHQLSLLTFSLQHLRFLVLRLNRGIWNLLTNELIYNGFNSYKYILMNSKWLSEFIMTWADL